MKVAAVFACIIAAAMGAEYFAKPKTHIDYFWDQWKVKYERNYRNEFEESMRRAIWEKNVAFVDQHNAEEREGEQSYKVAINNFSDKTPEELSQLLGLLPINDTEISGEYYVPHDVEPLPSTVDWRTQGYVTGVKSQGECYSCYAFAATGALEGQHAKIHRSLVSLSEQNLVDCSGGRFGNHGCNRGWIYRAFEYVRINGGVDTETSYPYESRDGICRFNKNNVGATCTGYQRTRSGDEVSLQSAVATVGPIAVAIDGGQQSFFHYSSGVYDDPSCIQQTNHAVLVIGYGSEGGKDYWLVKNSWGTNWGEGGYVKMRRNRFNQCNIATQTSYPLM